VRNLILDAFSIPFTGEVGDPSELRDSRDLKKNQDGEAKSKRKHLEWNKYH